jgi:lipopolysaccharide assembly protein A
LRWWWRLRATRSIDDQEAPMRWIYLAVIILFAAATIIFAVQNFEIVTMSFLGINARVPLALLVAVAYLLGAATGGSLFAVLRRSYEESRRGLRGSS